MDKENTFYFRNMSFAYACQQLRKILRVEATQLLYIPSISEDLAVGRHKLVTARLEDLSDDVRPPWWRNLVAVLVALDDA
jgi:hypothetical protein